jgi:cyclase
MKTIRVIPRLDIKGPNLVKGVHLEGLRALGNPSDFAKYYYNNGADELICMDVVASLYNRNSILKTIREIAKKVFIPITVGGGIRSIEDISDVLKSGADKVCINTAAINNNALISAAADKFGSSTIVVSIEAVKQDDGEYFAFTDNGREYTGVNVVEWAEKVGQLGAGEILITSVDVEGTGTGCDVDLINLISSQTNIPVIAHGGIGTFKDAVNVVNSTSVDALSMSSILHYDAVKNIKFNKENVKDEGNFNFLNSNRVMRNIQPCSISAIKQSLHANGINVRL